MKLPVGLKKFLLKITSVIFVSAGMLFGRTTQPKPQSTPSIRERIAAVQKAAQQQPGTTHQPAVLAAQWGNWGNWRNWNNWANWTNWNNWGNWGNWANY
jgi:hypothetical protein